ncbi:MAG: alanine racemase [Streptomycetales bacterium]
MRLSDLTTPALLVERGLLERNLAIMAEVLPGPRNRPHVKAHKCTAIARLQRDAGHPGLTAATVRECEGLAAAGLARDVLLANEIVDARRLGALVEAGHRITLAVDSEPTVEVAAAGGVRDVVIDVNVGLPRCGCDPEEAGGLADLARRRGLEVRGVMGYEGHLQAWPDDLEERRLHVEEVMRLLLRARDLVGGDLVSAGGTGTHAVNTWAGEIQAGSYALMDSAYGKQSLPFHNALTVLATVIHVDAKGWAVLDMGLKAHAMDHGNPDVPGGQTWFLSDEHLTYAPAEPGLVDVGDRVRVVPAHVDPTVAYHEQLWLVDGEQVIERWPVDLRGW